MVERGGKECSADSGDSRGHIIFENSVTTPNNYFAADGHTRVMLFAMNISGQSAFALTAEVEDAEHRTYPLVVELGGPGLATRLVE
jgi:hypothetical protein